VLPEISNHRLHTLAEHFSIPIVHRHRAACDARATAEVFLRMLERLDHNGVRHLADARRFRLPAAQEMRADAQVARLENP
jgi:DNA polymerase-3 subunit alpha (Gram-positive type)